MTHTCSNLLSKGKRKIAVAWKSKRDNGIGPKLIYTDEMLDARCGLVADLLEVKRDGFATRFDRPSLILNLPSLDLVFGNEGFHSFTLTV